MTLAVNNALENDRNFQCSTTLKQSSPFLSFSFYCRRTQGVVVGIVKSFMSTLGRFVFFQELFKFYVCDNYNSKQLVVYTLAFVDCLFITIFTV